MEDDDGRPELLGGKSTDLCAPLKSMAKRAEGIPNVEIGKVNI